MHKYFWICMDNSSPLRQIFKPGLSGRFQLLRPATHQINTTLEIIKTKQELARLTDEFRMQKKTVGLVPTMGALHQGHLSLLGIARRQADITVCSIFVNPTQFNDSADLSNYPRPVEQDIRLLESAGCDILFMPGVSEMYAEDETWNIDLGYLETIMEGAIRPGHYQGVTQIVRKLFDLVKPQKAFFGQKDYQQVAVIKHMIRLFNLPVQLVVCPIVRDADGLALSSRNIHLSATERKQALALPAALFHIRSACRHRNPVRLKEEALALLQNSPGVKPDYVEILNANTLQPLQSEEEPMVALVAATVGKTRLIDNILLG